ncbi:MAG: ATP-binding protein [Candidatus Bathyarchaeota archaeon]|nr:ATP-binding protein [Candidatus Bathyarchaeota archaeon]
MILSIASGKGGTGKTTVAVNMAISLENIQLLDCDVEEPNAHLLLHPKVTETKPVYVQIPVVEEKKCDYCGECAKFCKFNAIFVTNQRIMFFPELCSSCGGCAIVCSRNAINKKKRKIGTTKRGSVKRVKLVYGELNVGEPMATPVIKAVKKQMQPPKEGDIIIDSPPGTSCPVIEAVHGSDYTILVTEPTPFGLYDLKIAVEVLSKLKIPFGVVVNRAGIGDKKVHTFCREKAISILLEIPYERNIAELYSVGKPFVLEMPEWKEKFRGLLDKIKESLQV